LLWPWLCRFPCGLWPLPGRRSPLRLMKSILTMWWWPAKC